MVLSRSTTLVLIDLIENKLAMLQVDDRDDLREVVSLPRCLAELRGLAGATTGAEVSDIPRRGRHRKLTALMQDLSVPEGLNRPARQSA